jgi:hypothetical protein
VLHLDRGEYLGQMLRFMRELEFLDDDPPSARDGAERYAGPTAEPCS